MKIVDERYTFIDQEIAAIHNENDSLLNFASCFVIFNLKKSEFEQESNFYYDKSRHRYKKMC